MRVRGSSPHPHPRRTQAGQATVELALLAPLLVLVALFVVQLLVLVRDRVLLVHTLREAAVAVAVAPDRERASEIIRRIEPTPTMQSTERGVVIRIETRLRTDLPVIGRFVPDLAVREQVEVMVAWK